MTALGRTDEPLGMASAGAVGRAEAQVRVSEHAARYVWASQLVAGRDVLDAGCGGGRGSGILADAGARHVIGVDSSAALIGEAEGAIEGPTDFVLGDLTALPFTDGSFEVVVCFDVVEHAVEAAAIVAELRRVLRPDGHLVISLGQPPSADGARASANPGAAADASAGSDAAGRTSANPNAADASANPGATADASAGPGAAGGAGANPTATAEPRPTGLEELVRGQFAEVGLYAQHGCLGSLVRSIDGPDGETDGQMQTLTRRLVRDEPAETRVLAVASVGRPPARLGPTAVVASLGGFHRSPGVVGDPASRRNGAQAVAGTGATAGLDAGISEASEQDGRIAALTRRLAGAEAENARIPELESYLDACERELRKFHSSLLGRIGKVIFLIRSALR